MVGLTSAEREELLKLRRENRRLKEEREILSKATAWFATESNTSKRSSDWPTHFGLLHRIMRRSNSRTPSSNSQTSVRVG
jgi:hypothetical protein